MFSRLAARCVARPQARVPFRKFTSVSATKLPRAQSASWTHKALASRAAAGTAPKAWSLQRVRWFSEAAEFASATNVTIHGAHGKYTHALFDAGAEAEKRGFKDYLSKLQDDLTALAEQFKSPTLQTFFNDPSSTGPEKLAALNGGKGIKDLPLQKLTKDLLGALAADNCLQLVPSISASFAELVSSASGLVNVVVTSAEDLTASQRKNVETSVSKIVGGKPTTVDYKIEPGMVGGLKLQLGDKYIDLSINSRIERMASLYRTEFSSHI